MSIADEKPETRPVGSVPCVGRLRLGTLAVAGVFALIAMLFFLACVSKNIVNPRLADEMPKKIIWAWERPEDLTFLDPNEHGVAFLSQTIYLEADRVTPNRRRQPLEIAPGSYVIAVTRIETHKETAKRPTLSDEMVDRVANLINAALDLPDIRGIQIDFDAVSSERDFYRRLVSRMRRILDTRADKSVRVPTFTMTALASWCVGDAWFNDLPVDEAVPMVFQMGADAENIRNFLRNGHDWREPLCRGSYGVSVDEAIEAPLKAGRRMYFFKDSAWKRSDIDRLREE